MIDVSMKYSSVIPNSIYIDIIPREVGWEPCRPLQRYEHSPKAYYLIYYVVSGKGTLICPRGKYHITAGQIFVIKPYEDAEYFADEKDPWSYIWVGFSGKLAVKLKESPDFMDFPKSELFEAFLKYPTLEQMKYEYLIGCLSLILTEICTDDVPLSSNSVKYIRKSCEFIEQNYMNRILVEQIAENQGVSRRYLSNLFKNDFGIPLKKYITHVRIRHACEFSKMNYSVSDTAKMVGYVDAFNFSRTFKKNIGISPSEYKERQ